MTTVHCPKCEADVSDSYEPADYSVGIMAGGYYCGECDLPIAEGDYESLDDDVPTGPAPRDPSEPIGTPISQLRGRPEYPGDPRYEEFTRIAKSWGFD